MGQHHVWVLGESRLTFPEGGELDGHSQGDGSHLQGKTIRLDSHDLQRLDYTDDDATFDDNDGDQRLSGEQTLDGTSHGDGTRIEAEYSLTLFDPDTGRTWDAVAVNLNEPGSGPAYGTVEGLAFVGAEGGFPPVGVDLTVTATSEGPRDLAAADLAAPMCFAAGTAIATPDGPVAVERLGPGDRVLLWGGGTAPVRRNLPRRLRAAELARDPRLRPVRIAAGALGRGRPERDLTVSRQHRLLAASAIVRRMFGRDEVLIAAHRLTALPGIAVDARCAAVTYHHLALDSHRIVIAEGAPAESFYAGPTALRSLPPALAAEMRRLFPAIDGPGAHPAPARAIPAHRRQARCVARHLRNRKALLGDPAG